MEKEREQKDKNVNSTGVKEKGTINWIINDILISLIVYLTFVNR